MISGRTFTRAWVRAAPAAHPRPDSIYTAATVAAAAVAASAINQLSLVVEKNLCLIESTALDPAGSRCVYVRSPSTKSESRVHVCRYVCV